MRKWISRSLAFGSLVLYAAGCGDTGDVAGGDEPADPTVEMARFEAEARPAEHDGAEASDGDQPSADEGLDGALMSEAPLDGADEAAYSGEATDPSGESIDKEKECTVQCTVASVGGASCPGTVSGTGNSKGLFGGTCKKACDRAELDAIQKLAPGCVLVNCFSEVCSSV